MGAVPDAVYGIFSCDRLPLQEILAIEIAAKTHGCREVTTLDDYRQITLKRVKDLFNTAFDIDTEWKYNFSSKVPLSIKNIQDINKILFFEYLLENKPNDNYIFLFDDLAIENLFINVIEGKQLLAKKVLPTMKAFGRIARTVLRVLLNNTEQTPSKVVFYSLSAGAPQANVDTYFGSLRDKISDRATSSTVYLASGNNFRLSHGGSQIPIEAFASFFDVVKAFTETISECLSRKNVNRISQTSNLNHNIIEYLKVSELKTGEFFMLQFCKRAYDRMLEKLRPKTLVHPFENRSWEKLLMLSARSHQVSNCVGYQHSSLTSRHLAFQIDDNESTEIYFPDSIITVGDVTADYLKSVSPIYQDKLIVGGSLRRVDVASERSLPDISLLIAISSSFSEALRLLVLLNDCRDSIDVPVIIRSHPTIPIKELFDSFNWPNNISLSEGKTLTADLLSVSLIAYSSSTVSLEGMLYGRLPVFIDIGDVPDGDPVLGECTVKYTVNKKNSLADIINEYKLLDSRIRNEKSDLAISYASNYLQKVDGSKLEKIIDKIIE
ncbi:hypothetical protein A9Q79_08010 [Methylophaga sp. 42_25_T18]|nr:hypothetical protein A9Q79_08010 [Methylophaga sp. 42_25_T18]